MNKGFTLIELLVVVLIIGILAAIALPQYQKAVERSRMAEAVQVLGDLGTAQSIFYMQHNAFAASLPDLNGRGDVNIPNATAEGKWTLAVGNANGQQTMTRAAGMYSGAALRLTVYDDGSILKECLPNGHDAFCTMAETAGYGPEEARADEEANESQKVKELVGTVSKERISDRLKEILESSGRAKDVEDGLPVQAAPQNSIQAEAQEIAVEAVAEADEAIEEADEVAEVAAEKASVERVTEVAVEEKASFKK